MGHKTLIATKVMCDFYDERRKVCCLQVSCLQ